MVPGSQEAGLSHSSSSFLVHQNVYDFWPIDQSIKILVCTGQLEFGVLGFFVWLVVAVGLIFFVFSFLTGGLEYIKAGALFGL